MSATAPASDVEICNLALDYLNQEPITSIDTPSGKSAERCARWYHQVRRSVLRKHPWNFATKRAGLAEAAVEIPFGYDQAFALPSDFVRLISIGDEVNGLPTNDDGELLIRYIYDITNVSQFDALFIDVLALELAIAMGQAYTSSETKIEQLRAMLKSKAPMAYSVDGQERPPSRVQRSRWLSRRTRGRSRSYGSPYINFDGDNSFAIRFQIEDGYIYTESTS